MCLCLSPVVYPFLFFPLQEKSRGRGIGLDLGEGGLEEEDDQQQQGFDDDGYTAATDDASSGGSKIWFLAQRSLVHQIGKEKNPSLIKGQLRALGYSLEQQQQGGDDRAYGEEEEEDLWPLVSRAAMGGEGEEENLSSR